MDDQTAGAGGPQPPPEPPRADPIAGELVTETLDYDGGRQVTVYVPPDPPQAVVFAGDGQGISQWGGFLEAADVPSTMIVGVHGLADERPRLEEYSPVFDAEREVLTWAAAQLKRDDGRQGRSPAPFPLQLLAERVLDSDSTSQTENGAAFGNAPVAHAGNIVWRTKQDKTPPARRSGRG